MAVTEMVEAVQLPQGEDRREWIAFNLDYFLNCCVGFAEETEGVCVGCYGDARIGNIVISSEPEFVRSTIEAVAKALEKSAPNVPFERFQSTFDAAAEYAASQLMLVFGHLYEHRQVFKSEEHFLNALQHFGHFVRHFELVPEANFILVAHIHKLKPLR